MTTMVKGALNCGQVRGPVQMGFARSVEPVVPQDVTITRVAITTEADAERKDTEMGRKYIVPYGLYRCEGYMFRQPRAQDDRLFRRKTSELFWQAILNMFENDRSAARGKMAVRELIVFKHDSELGCAPAWKLFDAVKVVRKDPQAVSPARAYRGLRRHGGRSRPPRRRHLHAHGVTMYRDEDLLQLSGLQHFAFCRRQWALVYVEGQWQDNLRTVEGGLLHRRAHDEAARERRGDTLILRGLAVVSHTLGLTRASATSWSSAPTRRACPCAARRGCGCPYPVEYKRGKPKEHLADELQLCAQAMCLEEMLCCAVPAGALFYGEPRRRTAVEFSAGAAAGRPRRLRGDACRYARRGYTPKAKTGKALQRLLPERPLPAPARPAGERGQLPAKRPGGDSHESIC